MLDVLVVVLSPTRSVVRLAASLLTKLVDSLAPSITSVLVHGKQVSVPPRELTTAILPNNIEAN